MQTTGNTILVTGGSAGIGRELARAFNALGNTVIVTGRREDALEDTIAGRSDMHARALDVADAAAIERFVDEIVRDFPALNVVLNNAGIMVAENIRGAPESLATAEAIVTTNLLGPIRLTLRLLPHLLAQGDGAVMTVSSGLAFVPLAATPTYCATKAAIHSWSQSLRHQLKGTGVEVIEIAPPAVRTDLMPTSRQNPNAMDLDAYIAETMSLVTAEPTPDEVLVERVKLLRLAEQRGAFADVFGMLNPSAPK